MKSTKIIKRNTDKSYWQYKHCKCKVMVLTYFKYFKRLEDTFSIYYEDHGENGKNEYSDYKMAKETS